MAPKKEKGQKMQLGDFLTDASYGSWADEMEDMPMPAPSGRSTYGSGSDRQWGSGGGGFGGSRFEDRSHPPREQLPLPTSPPFTVHLGNLSFDATEGDIHDFFRDCDVDNVRIVEDKMDSKPKGFGYVEFKTLEGIKKALDLSGTQFQGRNIRISVAEPQKDRHEARDFGDWTRKGPLPDLPGQQQRRASDRPGFGSGDPRGSRNFQGDNNSDAGSERPNRREFGSSDGRVRDFGNWDRKGPLNPVNPSTGPHSKNLDRPVSRDGSVNMRHNSPSWGEGKSQDGGSRPPRRDFSDRPHVEKPPTAAEQDTQWRARMRPDPPPNPPTPTAQASRSPALSTRELSTPPSPAAAPPPSATRPKLNLAKRTISESPGDSSPATAPSSDSKSSPFGAARPIDTATREREVVEKREQVLKEKKEADDKAREEKRIADEKAKEERKSAKEAENAAQPNKSEASPRSAGHQQNGEKRNFSRREKPDNKAKAEKENGLPTPPPGKQYEILRRQADEASSVVDADDDAEQAGENGILTGDKETKPQEIVRDVQDGTTNGSTADKTTAEALEEEGWSTVSKPGRKGRNGNQAARAIAS